MSILIPQYILDAQIDVKELRYKWDDCDIHKADRPCDPEFVKVMENFFDRANIAFTISVAEWVVYRFKGFYSDQLVYDYIEGLWAMNVDWRYCRQFNPIDNEWAGPILRPIELAILIVNDVFINSVENDTTAINPSWISNLAKYVLQDSTSFFQWRNKVIDKMRVECLVEEDDPDDIFMEKDLSGFPIPREFFDPRLNYSSEGRSQLVNKFLINLDWSQNPFLRSPQEMLELGFIGTPYCYNEKIKNS